MTPSYEECLMALLRNVTTAQSPCRACNANILWVRHGNNRLCPYNMDGTSHFTTCPAADRFSKGGKHGNSGS